MGHPPALVLLGIVVASAIGALALCAVLLRHGLAPDSESEPLTAHRLFLFRLAHVVALGCFAISAILGVAAAAIAWRAQSLASETAVDDAIAVRRDVREQRDALLARLHRLDERLTAAERRLDAAPSTTRASSGTLRGEKAPAGPRRARATADHRPPTRPGPVPGGPPQAQEQRHAASSRLAHAAPAAIEAASPMLTLADPPAPSDPAASAPADSTAVAPPGPLPALAAGATPEADAPAPPPEDASPASFCGRDSYRVCSRVTRWAAGEVKEFRDGVRREVDDVRQGVERVKAGLRRVRNVFAP